MVNSSVGICGVQHGTLFFDVLEHEYDPKTSPCIPFAVSAAMMLKVTSYFVCFVASSCAAMLLVLCKNLIPMLSSRQKQGTGQLKKRNLSLLYTECCIFGLLGTLFLAASSANRFYFVVPLDTPGGVINSTAYFIGISCNLVALCAYALTFQELTILSLKVPLVNIPPVNRVIGSVVIYCVLAIGIGTLLMSTGTLNSGFLYLRYWNIPALPAPIIFLYYIPSFMQPILESFEEVLRNTNRFEDAPSTETRVEKKATDQISKSLPLPMSMNQIKKYATGRRLILRVQRSIQVACTGTVILTITLLYSPLLFEPYVVLAYQLFHNTAQLSIISIMIHALFRKYDAASSKSISGQGTKKVVPKAPGPGLGTPNGRFSKHRSPFSSKSQDLKTGSFEEQTCA